MIHTLSNLGVKRATTPSAGVWYAVPQKGSDIWKIIYLRDDEMADPSDEFAIPENTHYSLWKHVRYYLQKEFKLSEDQMDEIAENYTGLPRGRIAEPIEKGGNWIVLHGNDYPKIIMHQVLTAFGLLELNSLGKVKLKEEDHERMDPNEKKIVWKELNLK